MGGEGGSETSRRGWWLPLQQKGQEADIWETFLTIRYGTISNLSIRGVGKAELSPLPSVTVWLPGKATLTEKTGSWAHLQTPRP